MYKFKQHYFICTNARPPFAKPSCGPAGSHQILMRLKEEVEKRGLEEEIKVTGCACLGPCEQGPVMVVYPEGTWYQKITVDDVPDIITNHMLENKPVERLLYHEQADLNSEEAK